MNTIGVIVHEALSSFSLPLRTRQLLLPDSDLIKNIIEHTVEVAVRVDGKILIFLVFLGQSRHI